MISMGLLRRRAGDLTGPQQTPGVGHPFPLVRWLCGPAPSYPVPLSNNARYKIQPSQDAIAVTEYIKNTTHLKVIHKQRQKFGHITI